MKELRQEKLVLDVIKTMHHCLQVDTFDEKDSYRTVKYVLEEIKRNAKKFRKAKDNKRLLDLASKLNRILFDLEK